MRRLALQILALTSTVAPAAAGALSKAEVAADLSFIEAQAQKTLNSLTPGFFPDHGGQTGTWSTVPASNWTSGFFPGELWLLYQATGSTQWETDARAWTAALASQATRTDTHDVGFIIGTSFGNGYRLTGDSSYASTLLTAAGSLATRYNPAVGAVRSWSWGVWQYPVIIDNMMTLGPLQWGVRHGGDTAWGRDAAIHAVTSLTRLVRSGGSTYQIADFNPTTGAFLGNSTWQGLSVTSTWARGQAWGIYGFAQAYEATGNAAFLNASEVLAFYFAKNLPSDGVPYWDFSATPGPTTPRDTSAAAIAADGMMMLSQDATTASIRSYYLTQAQNILGALDASYLAPASGEAVLIGGTGDDPHNSEVNTALIFGDYYFTEALLRLQNYYNGAPGWTLYGGSPAPPLASEPSHAGAVPEPSPQP